MVPPISPSAGSVISANLQAAGFDTAAVLTKRQAAHYLQVTPRYLERMAVAGRLKVYKPTGKLWRVRRSDLDAFLESGATFGGAQ
jgi:excisionase family DNA binding protein